MHPILYSWQWLSNGLRWERSAREKAFGETCLILKLNKNLLISEMQSALRIESPLPKNSFYQSKNRGFSLVEVMVSLGMLALVSVGLVLGQLQSNRLAGKARSINEAKVVLRQMVDRFQTVSKGDPSLAVATTFTSDAGCASIFYGSSASVATPVKVVLFDEDPDSNGGAGSENKLLGTVERQVTYASGSPTTASALANATFRVRFTEYDGNETVMEMSTNRAIP